MGGQLHKEDYPVLDIWYLFHDECRYSTHLLKDG